MILLAGLPGGWEWIAIIAVVLILFGGKKIPELMRGVGKGIKEFNTARAEVKDEIERGYKDQEENDREREREVKTEKSS